MSRAEPNSLDTCRGFHLARDVEVRVGSWVVWFGRSTRRYWAMSVRDSSECVLVEAGSAEELLRRLLTITTLTCDRS